MKLANPLYYPLAVLAGGIILIAGTRFMGFHGAIILPASAAVATAGATVLKSREPETLSLSDPDLERELQSVKQQANLLAQKANSLREESARMLTGVADMELLGMVQYACDRATEVPGKIDKMARRLQGDKALLSIEELEQQLKEVKAKLSASRGVAKDQLRKLAESLNRNIELARQGEDAREAQFVSLSTAIQDSAGLLQQMQNKLRIADLTNSEEKQELELLSQNLRSFQENIDLLVVGDR